MKQLVPMDDYGVFVDGKYTVRVDSLMVAEIFEKKHKNVLRDIQELDCSEEFRQLNFEPAYYKDEQGKKRPCMAMTRDGFTFLVMGYRGKKAAAFKEAYIHHFNQMEEFIKNLLTARDDFPLLTEQIQLVHPDPKPYHFSNECNLLTTIITGINAKRFREIHDIPKGQSIRPFLTPEQLELLERLQKIDIGLILAVPDYQQRKIILTQYRDSFVAKRNLSVDIEG